MPVINTLIFDFARAVLDDSVDGIVAEQNATNAICDLFRSQQEEIDRLKKELAEANEKILTMKTAAERVSEKMDEVQMEIERMEQKSKEFSEANLSVVKLRLEQKITKQEGNDMLKEKFPDMVSDDEEYCDNCDTELTEDTHIFIFTKGEDEKIMCDTCGQELSEKMRKDGWIRDDEDVDSRDAPNIYPYKKCSECGERSSCGQYKEDDWVCDGCDTEY